MGKKPTHDEFVETIARYMKEKNREPSISETVREKDVEFDIISDGKMDSLDVTEMLMDLEDNYDLEPTPDHLLDETARKIGTLYQIFFERESLET